MYQNLLSEPEKFANKNQIDDSSNEEIFDLIKGDILVSGNSSENKLKFFNEMQQFLLFVSEGAYNKIVGTTDGIAHFIGTVYETDQGKKIENPCIIINRDKFIVDGKNFRNLIPVVIFHESEELWLYAKTGKFSLSPKPPFIQDRVAFGHKIALRNEWIYAFAQNLADEYLSFLELILVDHPQLQENRDMYKLLNEKQYYRK